MLAIYDVRRESDVVAADPETPRLVNASWGAKHAEPVALDRASPTRDVVADLLPLIEDRFELDDPVGRCGSPGAVAGLHQCESRIALFSGHVAHEQAVAVDRRVCPLVAFVPGVPAVSGELKRSGPSLRAVERVQKVVGRSGHTLHGFGR